ncbi:uncharacterized protein LOC127161396 [Labeo rohita]|uniref:uncharacterized protein LOC127161396 n=1 Tax=Labeo rohita TaxID=84645 RepID=UPI0021E2AF21|nr:uncharacterized protein LOC127161396 [Labeo rohita]
MDAISVAYESSDLPSPLGVKAHSTHDPGSVSDELMEAGLISKYFSEGHTYDVILDFLKTRHNIFLSLSTLKRKLKNAGLTRRTDYSPIETVNAVITHELTGSGQLLGYRALWQTLRQKYFLTVKRDDVMDAVRRLDPFGVQLRRRRRFIQRGYFTAGPNQVWHIDGYDKLKPFGVAISGCIDGFSRKVMWLRSGSSNNDPGIIAYYYMKCVSEFGAPACLRTDCGTENGTMVAIHCALRAQHTDDFAGVLSHMYGTSTANQCIESWWSFFRKQRTQFWIDLFSDLRERHLFNGSHEHKCLLRYVFLGILQKDLMSTENFGITTPSDLFVSCLVILVNQKPCITCLTGLMQGTVDSQCHNKLFKSLRTFCHHSAVFVVMVISKVNCSMHGLTETE